MRISYILFANLFLLTLSHSIIRDLPYNIYHIEDMEQYQNKYLSEGNKFFIRFPYNLDKEIKFYLTIPKNITLFPIYSSEYSEYPNDKEIANTDFKKEIEVTNREDLQYSIYSFDIKKTESYQVLYFQNNENLNYVSFYASSNSSSLSNYSIFDLQTNVGYYIRPLYNDSSFYIKLNISGSSKKDLKYKQKLIENIGLIIN